MLYVIQSVPARREVRKRLLEQLPPAVVVEDDGPPPGNPWRGYQLCLKRLLEDSSTHGVLLQDDSFVCHNFEPALERILRVFPEQVVCLFYPGHKSRSAREYRKARQMKQSFFRLNSQDFVPVVATLWPREKAENLLQWADGREIPGLRAPYRSDDAVVGSWMRHTKEAVYATFPSLVQHPDDVDPVKDGPHKAGHGADKGRVALAFCEGDPLEIF